MAQQQVAFDISAGRRQAQPVQRGHQGGLAGMVQALRSPAYSHARGLDWPRRLSYAAA